MNERIKELSKQAGFFADQDNDKIEKFAELIIDECIGVLKKRFMGDLNREDMEVRRCIEDIRKHFPVEL
jgi:hypothetical protein